MSSTRQLARLSARVPSIVLLVLLVLPFVSLALVSSPSELAAGMTHRLFLPALALSARTTLVSLALVIALGTPLAWWLATARSRAARVIETLVDLPIVMPPAVVGIALLTTFGRSGLFGPALDVIGAHLPFTTAAVVLAQIVVSAPFYVQSASSAFREVDPDLVIVARTLGASRSRAFARVAVPIALPGLLAGAAMSWARSIGEFGATLLFAGNLPGTTQTMPLAIYGALESDVRAAIALSLVLAAIALVLLLALRAAPSLARRARGGVRS